MKFSRVICIVLDGVGVGELPDAAQYGDAGSNSLKNTALAVGGLNLPSLGALGLGNIISISGVPPVKEPQGFFGRAGSLSPGKDSTSGHWEMMGCILARAFPTYPSGFPGEIVGKIEKASGCEFIGNYPASGTEIIERLGEEHLKTGKLILYTSQDSVFQIAAHEDIFPVEKLYEVCERARAILVPPHDVARVIARPFAGRPGSFHRTSGRKDFSLPPPAGTVLDRMLSAGLKVIGIGKIDDLFGHRGLSKVIHTSSNEEGMKATREMLVSDEGDLIFTNLVDFDMMWGHRNDPRAYALGLEDFDSFLGNLMRELKEDDLLIITSDHGCDPTTESTDHSREYVPVLLHYQRQGAGGSLGTRRTIADVGKTIACNFGLKEEFPGKNLSEDI